MNSPLNFVLPKISKGTSNFLLGGIKSGFFIALAILCLTGKAQALITPGNFSFSAKNQWDDPDPKVISLSSTGSFVYPGTGTSLYWSCLNTNCSGQFKKYDTATNTWTNLANHPDDIAFLLTPDPANGVLYALRSLGTDGTQFHKYDIATATWTALTNFPNANNAGGIANLLIYPGTGDFIYAGQASAPNFYKYSISGNSWSAITAPPASTGRLIYPGAGNYLYLLNGISTPKVFRRYNMVTDAWSTLTVPDGIGTGAQVIKTNNTDELLALKGGGSNEILRYVISTDTWTTLSATTPTPVDNASALGILSPSNTDILFVLPGDKDDNNADRNDFYMVDLSNGKSQSLKPPPEFILYGANLFHPGTGNLMYTFAGNGAAYSKSFYAYNTSTDEWSQLADFPETVGIGTSLTYPGSGDFLYALRGVGGKKLYRYSITGNSWSALADSPETKLFGGFIGTGRDNYLYALMGNSSKFARYNTQADTWETLADTPATIVQGSHLVYPGTGDTIYALKGLANTFYKYSISDNTWSTGTNVNFTGQNNYGAYLVYPGKGKFIYATRGNSTNEFYRYDMVAQTWESLAEIHKGKLRSGGSMAYAPGTNYLYLLHGNKSKHFSRYSVFWTGEHPPNTPTNSTPTSGSTNVALAPTLTGNAYSDEDSNAHTNSHWQVSLSPSFATTVWDSTDSSAGAVTATVGTSLSMSTVYYWRVRYKDSNSEWSNWSHPTPFTTLSDVTPPTVGSVLDDGAFQISTSDVSASWSGFSDANGIAEYSFSAGTSAGADNVVSWTAVGTDTSRQDVSFSINDGDTIYFNVRAKDPAGNVSTVVSSDGIKVDATAPASGTIADDGTVTGNGTQLSTSWSGFTDANTISEYSYSIGTSAGDISIKGWTSAGTNTTVVATGLTLTDMGNFFINVRAKDPAGNLSTVVSSDGIQYIADQVSPTAGTASDSGVYTSSTTALSVTASGFSDNTSIASYEYSIGTAAGSTTVRDWTNSGAGTTISATGLTLTSGTQYFVNVRAKDPGGNTSSVVSTDGITVDTAGPTGGTVTDQGSTTGSNTQLSVNWTGFADALSGIGGYSVSVGTSAGDSSVKAWASVGNVSSATITGLNLSENVTYFINVRAEDALSNSGSVVSSDGINYIADQEAPTAGSVSDSGQYTASASTLSFTWSGFTDNTSVASYEYSIGTSAAGTTVRDWTTAGNGSGFVATGLTLSSGTQYFINLRAKDGGGNTSSVVSTDGITVDTAAPTGGTVNDEGATTGNGSQLVANWTGFTDTLSGIGEYSYSIGISAGDISIKGWTSAGTNTSATATGLTLVDQQTYFFNVRAKDIVDNFGSILSSDGIKFVADATGPTTGTVQDEGASTTNKTALSASWTGFTDASGIAEYSYSIGTSAGDSSIKAWTSNGTATSVNATGLTLAYGTTYFFNVRAKDAFGNLSTVVSSNGIKVETVGGDMDQDGDIDIQDAIMANSFATGKSTPTSAQILFADVAEPKDGKITTEDANLILRCAKGTIRGNPQYPWCPALSREASATDGIVNQGGAP